MDPRVQEEFPSPPWHLAHLFSGRQLHVSDRSISVDEFARFQRRSAERDVADLVWACRDRYLFANDLFWPNASLPVCVEDGAEADFTEVLYPWDVLGVYYRRLAFDAQIDLFVDQHQRKLERWHAFKRRHVSEPILANGNWTRTVLEAAGLLDHPRNADACAIDVLFDNLTDTIERRYTYDDPNYD